MARPHKNKDCKRDQIVKLRISLTEKERIKQICDEEGLSISDWVRLKTLDSKPLLRKPHPDKEILLRLLAELGKQGSNLNQLAKHYNTTKNFGLGLSMQIVATTLEEVKAASQQLRTILYGSYQGSE